MTLNLNAELETALDLVTAKAPHALKKVLELLEGTGNKQADLIFSDERSLAASGSEELDLAGSLVDALGNTLTFARIKLVAIFAKSDNPENVQVGGAGSNGFVTPFADASDVVVVRPGGWLLLAAPDATAYVVTADTGDLLKIANGGAGGSVTYEIVIIGASA
jgi:hypothetical protein